MAWLNNLVLQIGPTIVVGVLSLIIIILVFIIFFLVYQKQQQQLLLEHARQELAQKSDNYQHLAQSNQTEINRLHEELRAAKKQQYIRDFQKQTKYLLVARSSIELMDNTLFYGLVKNKAQQLIPFISQRHLDHLAVNQYFHLDNDELITANTDDTTIAPNFANIVNEIIASDDDDDDESEKTRMAGIGIYTESSGDFYKGLPYLKVVEGNNKGEQYYLTFASTSLGRDKSNPIHLRDNKASRTHAILDYKNHQFMLKDNGSSNGTYHNDKQIKQTYIDFGDIIRIGNTKLLFTCQGYELRDSSPDQAIDAFADCLQKEPNFLNALKNLAFLMEKDISRQKEADHIWKKISQLEQSKS